MFVIESDATMVVPLILGALLECKQNPKQAQEFFQKYHTSK
jgi:deoxyhypusine synthase